MHRIFFSAEARSAITSLKRWRRYLESGKHSLIAATLLLATAVLTFIWWVHMTRVASEKDFAIQGAINESRNVAAIVAANFDEVLG